MPSFRTPRSGDPESILIVFETRDEKMDSGFRPRGAASE
jgi:hypothetical protein